MTADSQDKRVAGCPNTHAGSGYSTDVDASDASEILEWAADNVPRLAVTTSFQSSGLVIIHMLQQIRPGVPVLFLETGFHFPETIDFARDVAAQWSLNLVMLRGEHGSPERQAELYGARLHDRDPDRCCTINKVKPLQAALENCDGWISGLRRDQTAQRTGIQIIGRQLLPSGKFVLTIHPLAGWTKADVDRYVRRHGIPVNPLSERGFASIGCRPCTRAIRHGESERDGRWPGTPKTECGIHTIGGRR